jgi:hypothetical protein
VGAISDLERTGDGSERLKRALTNALRGEAATALTPLRDAPSYLAEDALADLLEIKEKVLMLEVKLRKLKK